MKIPQSKEECFASLDKELSKEDKQYLIEDEDASFDVHFSLAMWIRNNWIYQQKEEDIKGLMRQFVNPDDRLTFGLICYSADMASSTIINSYIDYLKTKIQ